jgi:hypothetical protein
VESWLKRVLRVVTWALLLWLLLRRFVPAHPIEQPLETLLLVAALACVTTAESVAKAWARRLLLGATVALVIATFFVL